ncbi:hypothetical protein [Affinirhizobium pseudoryzae]|uniref:hypothetical protein n=1 Tax=Allorhizobium pseudoryzae TaxID=379684 RepID=UPI0013EB3D15|nr:hypothetical protein [Allorhizobium pseudoryzae]
MLAAEVAAFIEGQVMILVATRDEGHRPMIGRGSGARHDRASGLVHVLVSQSQWPLAVEHALPGRPIATTFVQPDNYRSFQIKGQITASGPADDAATAWGRHYVETQLALMAQLGVTRLQLSSTLSDRDLWHITFRPSDIFEQTPGPGAGRRFQTTEAVA